MSGPLRRVFYNRNTAMQIRKTALVVIMYSV